MSLVLHALWGHTLTVRARVTGGRRIVHSDGRRHRTGPVTRRHGRPALVLPAVRLGPTVLGAHVRAQGRAQPGRRLGPARVAGRPQVVAGRAAGRRPQGRSPHLQPDHRDGPGHLGARIRGTRVSTRTPPRSGVASRPRPIRRS